jgi:hypothetical protein
MEMDRIVLLALSLIVLAGATPAPGEDRFAADRQHARKQRDDLVKAMDADRGKRAEKAAAAIGELVAAAEKSRAAGQSEALGQLLDGLKLLDPELEAPLRERVVALPAVPAQVESLAQQRWESLLRARRDSLLAPTRRLAQQAINLGVADVAAELMRQYLTFYPDDPVVHANMGLTRVRGHWYGPKTLPTARQGIDWDDALGWVVADKRARYEKGEYFDLGTKQWTTLEAADQAHATLDHPWVLQTEHLELRGNAKLKDLVDAANRLEAFYAQIFSVYALFFTTNGQGADLRLVFGMAEHPRLVVNIERGKPDYQHALPVGAGWSDGMFIGGRDPASYFYVGSDQVLYHEFTHQVLGVFSAREEAPAWLAEGIAVYSQSPVWIDGNLVLGHVDRNMHIQHYLREARAGKALPLDRLLAMASSAEWAAARDPMSNYAAAGAFAYFCMEADHHRHRADFVDFLRDSYLGLTGGHPVWDYLGETRERMSDEFTAFMRGAGNGDGGRNLFGREFILVPPDCDTAPRPEAQCFQGQP